MTKETKNIITRDICKSDLKHMAKADLLQDVVLFVIMLLIFVPFILMAVHVAKYILILGVVVALACTIAPVVFACRIILDITALRLVERGGFSIVKDTVSRLSKGEIPKKYSEGRHTVDVIYFTKYGRCTSSSLKTPFDLSSVGDEFYLVVLHNKKQEIALAFHSMMYECKDVEPSSVSVE